MPFEIEFDNNEEEVKPDFGPVGSIVDIRTYRRWLPNKGRHLLREIQELLMLI